MRFDGVLASWNDERGFGRIESSRGGEPVFVHVSAWPRGHGRPQLNQAVTHEIEFGPKGKRARKVQPVAVRRGSRPPAPAGRAPGGTATRLAVPAFVVVSAVVAAVWELPLRVAGWYLVASAATFIAHAADKSAAAGGSWRTPESTRHALAPAGGWAGALPAQQVLRHKSTERAFGRVSRVTVPLDTVGLLVVASRGPRWPTPIA